MQFPDIARDLANDLIEEGVTKSRLANGCAMYLKLRITT